MHYNQAKEYARKLRKESTPAENVFWQNVRNRKFHNYKFYRQYIFKYALSENHSKYFIVDFYCHSES